jgi:transposase
MEPGSKALRAPDIVKSLRVIVSPLALQTHKFDPVIVHERTFGWFGKYRRLSKDYEYLTASSEAVIDVAMIHLMVRRIEAKTLF